MSFTANANGPRGFDPVKAKSGTPNRMRDGRITGTYATAMYTGQPVAVHTDGYLIVLADDANVVAGVFAGCEYVTAAGDIIFSPYWPAPGAVKTGTVPLAKYYPAEDSLFLIHADETLAQLDVGDYFALTTTVGTGGSTITGRSSAEVDASTGNASAAGLLVQCVEISPREEGGDLSVATIMTVQFVRPQFGGKIDGAA
jgi:hypothetical protein